LHARPIGILNVRGYFDRLLEFLDHALDQGFLDAESRALLTVAPQPRELLDALAKRWTSTGGI
jgi:predicted Rossmann-fold nucleotide-binding protein